MIWRQRQRYTSDHVIINHLNHGGLGNIPSDNMMLFVGNLHRVRLIKINFFLWVRKRVDAYENNLICTKTSFITSS